MSGPEDTEPVEDVAGFVMADVNFITDIPLVEVSVSGQMVVEIATTEVWVEYEAEGQSVMLEPQSVMVTSAVE